MILNSAKEIYNLRKLRDNMIMRIIIVNGEEHMNTKDVTISTFAVKCQYDKRCKGIYHSKK